LIQTSRGLGTLKESDQKAVGISFAFAVDRYLPVKALELAAGKYRDQWRDSIDKYAIPVIGNMLVHDIGLEDILRVLEPIWSEKNVTADKLRRKLNEVLDFCTVKGHRSGPNPARWEGNLSHALGSLSGAGTEEHFPALQFKDLPRFWDALCNRGGMGAAALSFQILTATRTGAVRYMTWDEVDLVENVWTVQPERQASKIGKKDGAKRIPLTDDMVRLLDALPRQDGSNLVFWAPRGGALSDATMAKLMRVIHEADLKLGNDGFIDAKTKVGVVPHGTRSTFKNWAIEKTNFDWQLSEVALWHKIGNKVESSYARMDMLEKRRQMMADWGEFVRREAAVPYSKGVRQRERLV
jgi:integrase